MVNGIFAFTTKHDNHKKDKGAPILLGENKILCGKQSLKNEYFSQKIPQIHRRTLINKNKFSLPIGISKYM